MRIIPVLDIKDGIVVHAKQGNRADYLPLQSKLCQSADVFDVINVFQQSFNPDTIYIADLNAITGQGRKSGLLKKILQSYCDITFWLDAGYPLPDEELSKLNNFMPVLGSESFTDDTVYDIEKFAKNFILSLDYSTAGELGAKTLFSTPELWPKHVIIMSLPKVGSNLGPDLARLEIFSTRFQQHTFIAAGGVRDQQDLSALEKIGIHTVLLATALHNGQINPCN